MKWHIWDFPDTVYLKFNDEFRMKLFDKLYKHFGTHRKLSYFGCSYPAIVTALRYGSYKGMEIYTNMKLIKKILILFPEIKEEIERNVIAYRCRAGNPVINPVLPIEETPEIYSIVVHMIGDGSAGKGKTPYYSNTCKELRDDFKKNLRIFGEVNYNEYLMHTNVYCVTFPKAISDILSHIFNVKLVYSDSLPIKLFTASESCKIAGIAALFDDEGTASTMVSIRSSSQKLLQQAKEILKDLDIETGIVSGNDITYYSLSILAKSQEDFLNKIKPIHPKKINALQEKVKYRNRHKTLQIST